MESHHLRTSPEIAGNNVTNSKRHGGNNRLVYLAGNIADVSVKK